MFCHQDPITRSYEEGQEVLPAGSSRGQRAGEVGESGEGVVVVVIIAVIIVGGGEREAAATSITW